MGKFSIYAVAQGVDPIDGTRVFDKKFYTWAECSPYVTGASFCRYKGFNSETDADIWLDAERNKRRAYPALKAMEEDSSCYPSATASKPFTPYPQPNTTPINDYEYKAETKEIPTGTVKFCFSNKCMDLGLDPNQVLLFLMKQWTDMANMMNVSKPSEPEDDDEPPW